MLHDPHLSLNALHAILYARRTFSQFFYFTRNVKNFTASSIHQPQLRHNPLHPALQPALTLDIMPTTRRSSRPSSTPGERVTQVPVCVQPIAIATSSVPLILCGADNRLSLSFFPFVCLSTNLRVRYRTHQAFQTPELHISYLRIHPYLPYLPSLPRAKS